MVPATLWISFLGLIIRLGLMSHPILKFSANFITFRNVVLIFLSEIPIFISMIRISIFKVTSGES